MNNKKSINKNEAIKPQPTSNPAMQRLGWSDFFQRQLEPEPQNPTTIGRVIGVRKNYFLIHDGIKERLESYNKMRRELQYNADREHKSADRIEKENRKWIAVKVKQMKQIRSAK